LVAPALLIMFSFFVWPVIQGFLTSLKSGFGFEGDYVGTENYRIILTDPRFWNSLRVSIIFTLVFLLISGGIGLIIATFLTHKPPLYQFYAAAIYIPYISTPVIGAIIWQNMLSEPFGLIDMMLTGIGLPAVPWTKTPTLSLLSLIFVQVWFTVGYNSILFMAGLQQIPKDYYEAAEMEGCGWVRQLIHVTLPLIIPTITFVVHNHVCGHHIHALRFRELVRPGAADYGRGTLRVDHRHDDVHIRACFRSIRLRDGQCGYDADLSAVFRHRDGPVSLSKEEVRRTALKKERSE
jgi:ABC-type sugar transport system permease subunit